MTHLHIKPFPSASLPPKNATRPLLQLSKKTAERISLNQYCTRNLKKRKKRDYFVLKATSRQDTPKSPLGQRRISGKYFKSVSLQKGMSLGIFSPLGHYRSANSAPELRSPVERAKQS